MEIDQFSDLMIGIIHLCKGNVMGIEPLARILGNFERDKIQEMFKILNRFKKFLGGVNEKQVSSVLSRHLNL